MEVSIVMEFDSIETVKKAIEINAGIAILPASTVVTEAEKKSIGDLQTRGIHNRQLAVIHRKIEYLLRPSALSLIL